ncbi:uncharacterized protein TNCV_1955571 [Trichonephila clavipes]|nr:uncharacterized protein TNCV_1955571 [Trichonephila clavipes]
MDYCKRCCHSGIVVSDTDCCAVLPGSNSREGMDVCKCIVSLRHGGTPNSRRVASLLLRLFEGKERWEAPDHPQVVLPQICGGTEPKRTVPCMGLKAKDNDSCTMPPFAMINFVGLEH